MTRWILQGFLQQFASRVCVPHRSLRSLPNAVSKLKHAEVDLSQEYTVVTGNGLIVSWHPDRPFPYEHTKPLPTEEIAASQSPIIEHLHNKHHVHFYKKKGSLNVFDQCNMFYIDLETARIRYGAKRIDSTVKPSSNFPRSGI